MNLTAPKVIENDALVVLCLLDMKDGMTHHEFKLRAAVRGFPLSKSQCHNMLHRATGRVYVHPGNKWKLTSSGMAYREETLRCMLLLIAMEAGTSFETVT